MFTLVKVCTEGKIDKQNAYTFLTLLESIDKNEMHEPFTMAADKIYECIKQK